MRILFTTYERDILLAKDGFWLEICIVRASSQQAREDSDAQRR